MQIVRDGAPATCAEFVIAAKRMTGLTATAPPHAVMPEFSDVPVSHPAYADIMHVATT